MHSLTHLSVVLLALPQVQIAPAPPRTEIEFFDGEPQDLALPEIPGPNPAAERVWVAQHGHSRAAYRVSDKRRMMSETAVFPSPSSPVLDRVVAVELDEPRSYLFTLTEGALHREVVTTPAAPHSLTSLALPPTGTEQLTDVKVDPVTGFVFVLTSENLLVVSSTPAGLVVHSGSDGGAVILGVPAGCTRPLEVERLVDLDIAYDPSTSGLVAAVLAQLVPVSGARGGPKIVLFCDLDSLNGFASPRFGTGAQPFGYPHWNPQACCPEGFASCTIPPVQRSVNDVDLRTEGPSLTLYAAGNFQLGVQRLDATGVLAAGTPTVLGTNLPRIASYVRASATPGVVHGLEAGGPFTVDLNTGSSTFLGEWCGPGGFKDTVLRQGAGGEELWVGLTKTVDAAFKVFDVSSTTAPTTAERWPAIYHSDGGVPLVLGSTLSVYMPTIGGVLRYTTPNGLNGSWSVPRPGYHPAGVFGSSVAITEHIDISDGFDPPHPAHLFTANGWGGFDDFPLDVSGNPLRVDRYLPTVPTIPTYGNDVVFVADMNGAGTPYVLTDFVDRPARQAYLVAWRWDAATLQWVQDAVASAAICYPCDPFCTPPREIYTDTIHYQRGTAGHDFAVLSHTHGVVVFDLGGLTSGTPASMAEVDRIDVCTPDAVDPNGVAQTNCYGAATSRDTLFVAFQSPDHIPLPLAQVTSFRWDAGSGTISHSPRSIVDNVAVSDPSWTGSYRLRFVELDPLTGAGRLYVCGNSGQVIELEHSGAGTYDLRPRSSWRSNYRHNIQDVRAFEFPAGTKRLLISKDADSFAIVTPR